MTPEKLLSALTDIDEEAILDAKKPPANKKVLSRRGAVVLIAAVMLMTMAVTAAARPDTAAWFRQFFQDTGKQALSQGQVQYINENTVEQKQSQTCNGYTVTVESAISDGIRGFIQMTLTGPEGIILDADDYCFDNYFELRDENWNRGHWGGGTDSRDDDPTDNTVPLLLELIPPIGSSTNSPNLTEHTWTLRLEDLYDFNWIDYKTAEIDRKLLASGVWEFEIIFAEDSTVIEIIEEPVLCPADVVQWPEWGQEKVLIASLRLRAMSAEMVFTFPEKGTEVNARFDEFYAVMDDGTQILMREGGEWPDNIRFTFDAPIVLEDVSHILLPDGTKIPMP